MNLLNKSKKKKWRIIKTTEISFGFKQTKKRMLQSEKEIIFRVVEAGDESEPFTDELAKALVSLWNDKNVQKAADMRSEYQLNDSAK